MFRPFVASKADFALGARVARGLHRGCSEDHLKHGVRLVCAVAATLGAVTACGADDAATKGAGTFNPGAGGTSANSGDPLIPSAGSASTPLPEQELDQSFRVPVVSGHWVWTANPQSGRVALIDAKTFTVKTALAGAGPTYLAALPASKGGSRALVINSISQDATLFSSNDVGDIETTATLEVHQGANAWAVTPDGRFAIAWTDASTLSRADASEGFQDITVLDLNAKQLTSKRLSVGYRPARLFMDDDNRYAYVTTDAGIDVVDLKSDDGPIVEREVPVSKDPANDTAKREVNMTPDGAFAFVRREGKDYITVVNVAEGKIQDVTLPGIVTDLDLSADASMAVAIIRDRLLPADTSAAGAGASGEAGQSQTVGASGGDGAAVGNGGGGGLDSGAVGGVGSVAEGGAGPGSGGGTGPGMPMVHASVAVLLPVAGIFDAPNVYDSVQIDDVFGSVALGETGQTALLYSNAVSSTHLTLLRLLDKQYRTVDLKVPVFSAVSSPDGAHAIALLRPAAGSTQPGAFAVVPVAKDLPSRVQGTQAVTVPLDLTKGAPAMVAISDTRALVTVTDGAGVNVAYLVSMPELTVEPFALDSVPLLQASGIVTEANQAFVAQHHPEGRITFIDLDSKELHTLTGFELSNQVRK
jgi:hypothetical protein